MGPMTGRGAGYCAGYQAPGFANPMPGRGYGMGRGRGWSRGRGHGYGMGPGRGWRHQYYATGLPGWARYEYAPPYPPQVSPDQEVDILKQQAEWLKNELEAISQRLSELEE